MNPLDYGLCCQTVTVYRMADGAVMRQIAEHCYLSSRCSTPVEAAGKSLEKKFRLIIPGDALPLQPGDRIYAGIGPEKVDWKSFVPAAIPALYEVSFVKPCCWQGEVIHWEAGNQREVL